MSKKKTNEQFIEDACKVHGDRYDYSLVEYINNKTKVKIICEEHGTFEQNPNDHIGKKSNCPICSGRKRKQKSQFIEDACKVHGDRYDYSLVEYINNKTKVKIICEEHGTFEQEPKTHIISKYGCSLCGYREMVFKRSKSTAQFIEDARKVHGDRYDYSLVEYINSKTKVKIICEEHGMFEQTPDNHVNSKHGCMECWNHRRPCGCGGYSEEYFDAHAEQKDIQGLLYVIEMYTVDEHFIKIGITKRTIKERYSITGLGPAYIVKNIIHEITMNLYDAWVLEQEILNSMKGYRYFPNIVFNGKTECLQPKECVLEGVNRMVFNRKG